MTEQEDTILFLEKELLRPEVRNSAEKIAELLSESFFEVDSSGNTYQYQKGDTFPGGPVNDGDWEICDFSLLPVSNESVLATYKAIKHTETNEHLKVTLRCSLWELEEGKWKVKFHQSALADNPAAS